MKLETVALLAIAGYFLWRRANPPAAGNDTAWSQAHQNANANIAEIDRRNREENESFYANYGPSAVFGGQ